VEEEDKENESDNDEYSFEDDIGIEYDRFMLRSCVSSHQHTQMCVRVVAVMRVSPLLKKQCAINVHECSESL